MSNISVNDMIENLSRWKKICLLMKSNKDIKVIEEIIKKINEINCIESQCKTTSKKITNDEKLNYILSGLNNGNELIVKESKLIFIYEKINIEEEWYKLSEVQKNKLSKLELNVIYSILYNPSKITFINKNKKDIINEIDFFINNKKRNKALKENKLI